MHVMDGSSLSFSLGVCVKKDVSFEKTGHFNLYILRPSDEKLR